ncbi:MAG: FKBP-type peptidyl-prolyl cis-trans isomerase [Pirellulaceae bacterium]|nr:FKBP-type peptidyl-prolyl cis-trans isomerase [Pirellulaceae bacterium]
MMSTEKLKLLICLIVLLVGTPRCFGQGAVQAVRGAADRLAAGQGKLTAGPVDPSEKKSPGAIDANASAEFKQTASGLKYRILRDSKKQKPTASDQVEVHYKGWLDNQKIFDSSYQRGQSVSFPLKGVIKGWTEGMQLVGVGGMIELYIPYKLGYGEAGTPGGPIPPKADLHFVVELLSIK